MEIEAFILIGGRSSRLGQDKAFLEFEGRSLAARALDTVRNSGIAEKPTFVAGSQTQFAIQAISLDAPFIFDLVPGRGPLGGLHAVLAYARTPWVFLLACDYPYVTPEIIWLLAKNISEEYGAVIPQQADGRLQPLCGFYRVETAKEPVEEMISRPRVPPPMHEIAEGLDPRIVGYEEYSHLPDADRIFVNINTMDDLQQAIGGDAN